MAVLTVTLSPWLTRVHRIMDPLRPGHTELVQGAHFECGGPGIHAAVAIRALGGEARALYLAGGETGHLLTREVTAEGLEPVPVPAQVSTRMCWLLVTEREDGGAWRAYLEEMPRVTDHEARQMLTAYTQELERCDGVVLCDPSTAPATQFLFREMVALARKARVPVLVDGTGPALREALAKGPNWVRVHREDWEDAFAGEAAAEHPATVMPELFAAGIEAVVLTNGAGPVRVFTRDGEQRLVPPRIGVRRDCWSGDCMSGAMMLVRTEGWDLLPAVRFGMGAGAANAARLSLAGFKRSEVDGFMPQIQG